MWDRLWWSLLTHCATSQKVGGSYVFRYGTAICHWLNPFSPPVSWGQLNLQNKRLPRKFPGGKGGRLQGDFKISHEFFIYFPNTTLLLMPYNLLSYFSKYFQQYAQYRTDKSKILTQSVHIPTCFGGGHYLHHGITLQAKTQLHNVWQRQQRCASNIQQVFVWQRMRFGFYGRGLTRQTVLTRVF